MYYNVIKHPIDLYTIACKIVGGGYFDDFIGIGGVWPPF
jgi:hypothetical protein